MSRPVDHRQGIAVSECSGGPFSSGHGVPFYVAATIQGECERLGVSLYPTGGFSSLTLTWQAAEGIRQDATGRPVAIVYVGDYDPAGVLGPVLEHLEIGE